MITENNSIPSYSSAGLAARDVFLDFWNDVNFYVEDADQENLYFEIFRRLFPSIKINQIFPLGGKTAIKNHVNDPANAIRAQKSVYILDKDFDDLLGTKIINNNVFYLSQYCIENLLIEDSAIVQIALEADPKTSRADIERILNINNFISESIVAAAPLFCLFYVVQQFSLGIKNCESKPEEFSLKGSVWKLDSRKVEQYNCRVFELMLSQNKIKSPLDYDTFITKTYVENFYDERNIGGKFILGLLYHYLRFKKVGIGNVSLESLMYRLARNGTLVKFKPLQKRVIAYLASNHMLTESM